MPGIRIAPDGVWEPNPDKLGILGRLAGLLVPTGAAGNPASGVPGSGR